MNLQEITAAVDAGKIVHWSHEGYRVIKDRLNQYLIVHRDITIGLASKGGKLNGDAALFYIAQPTTDDLLDIIGAALPFVEDALNDPAFKRGTVQALAQRMRAVLT